MDLDGNVLFVMNYTAGMTAVDFSVDETGFEPYYLYTEGDSTGYSRCILTYDELGYLQNVEYVVNSKN